jgi:hypothetical protein
MSAKPARPPPKPLVPYCSAMTSLRCQFNRSNSANAAAAVAHSLSEATSAKSPRYSVHAAAGISRFGGSQV